MFVALNCETLAHEVNLFYKPFVDNQDVEQSIQLMSLVVGCCYQPLRSTFKLKSLFSCCVRTYRSVVISRPLSVFNSAISHSPEHFYSTQDSDCYLFHPQYSSKFPQRQRLSVLQFFLPTFNLMFL
jgi:hypothetical protein